MAKFDFNTYEQSKNTSQQTYQRSNVGYFNSLKDDGDEAIVRFAYSSPSEFDLVTVHNVQVEDRWRKVSCLRSANDPLEKCPLCAKGEKVLYKFFVKLVEYTTDEMGRVVATPKVWERPVSFAKTLKSYFDEYGNLSDCVFKIKRHGLKGSLQTSYDIMFANPMIYKPEIYVKDFKDFETLDLAHHSYMNKSFEEMVQFVQTREFPAKGGSTAVVDTSVHDVQDVATVYVQQVPTQITAGTQPIITDGYVNTTQSASVQSTYTNPGNPVVQPTPQVQNVPTQTEQSTEERPRRIYQY